MSGELRGELHLARKDKAVLGSWRLEGERLHWLIDSQQFTIESNDDLSKGIRTFLRSMNRRNKEDNLELEACMTCKYFQMSSMARDMGRGQRGVCTLHSLGTEVCFRCDNYSKEEGDD